MKREKRSARRRGLGLSVALVATAVAAVAVVVTVASGDSPASASGLQRAIAIDPSTVPSRIAEFGGQATPEQSPAFKDGKITIAEYRTSVQATTACLSNGVSGLAGSPKIEVTGPTSSNDSFNVFYSYTITGGSVNTAAAGAFNPVTDIEKACQEKFQRQIEQAWHVQQLGNETYAASVASGFQNCATAAGVDGLDGEPAQIVGKLTTSMADPKFRDSLRSCMTEFQSVAQGLVPLPAAGR